MYSCPHHWGLIIVLTPGLEEYWDIFCGVSSLCDRVADGGSVQLCCVMWFLVLAQQRVTWK